MLDTIGGYDETECTSLKWDIPNFTKAVENAVDSMKGIKLGVVKQFLEVSDDKIVDIIEESIDKMKEKGAEVVELSFDYIDLCLPTYYLINYVEFFSATRKYDGRKYGYRIEEVCGEEVFEEFIWALILAKKNLVANIIIKHSKPVH